MHMGDDQLSGISQMFFQGYVNKTVNHSMEFVGEY